MTKMKYLLFVFICLFVFPFNARAACDYQRVAELSKIASNVQLSYSYYPDEDGIPIFGVNVSNITSDIYVVDEDHGIIGNTTADNLAYGYGTTRATFTVYSNDPNCKGERLLTQYVNFPSYNTYSNSYLCKDNSSFQYCKIWSNTSSLNTEDFQNAMEEYSKNNGDDTNIEDNNSLLDFINDNLVLIIVVVIVLILSSYVLLKRRRRRL